MPQSIVQPLRRWDPEGIGSYTLIGRLGAGAMGQVFLARSPAGRLVAVKTIRVELAEEAGFRARFAREVAAASRVSGVFTAAVIEADPDADLPWVATAYVPAPSLRTLVKKSGRLPVPAVRWLAAGCAEALASIHGAGLLHRDVKPSNVLVAPDGPRVIDFGVARATERIQLTSTRGAAGTPAYMAPEQARDSTQASPASDVFSLGATLVYAATGHPPYRGETVMDVLVRLATEPPDLDGLPDELSALVRGCLERVPRDRPSDAAILNGLGSFALSAGPAHVYLPDTAMSVIAAYRVVSEFEHHPRLAAGLVIDGAARNASDPGDSGGNATHGSGIFALTGVTDGSHTPLPGFESPAAFPLAARVVRGDDRTGDQTGEQSDQDPLAGEASPAAQDPLAGEVPPVPLAPPGEGDPASPARADLPPVAGPGRGRAWRRRGVRLAAAWVTDRALLPMWARVLIAVLLVATGAGIGLAAREAADPTGSAAGDSPLGPVAVPPALCRPRQPGTTPEICVNQPYGDRYTVYVIHGSGFQPLAQVTVEITGVGTSSDRPVTDARGTFSYAIDQGHQFFRGLIPPGVYEVVCSAPGEHSASATFRVYAVPPPPAQLSPAGGAYGG
jgi:hypothetical protein